MAQREDIATIDLTSGQIYRTFNPQSIGEGDKLGDRFGVRVTKDGVSYPLAGSSCSGYFIRSDGTTVAMNGWISGNLAYVDLPQACYAIEGAFTLAIKVVQGTSSTVTLRIVDGTVSRTTTDTIVDPGSVVPDLASLLAVVNNANNATQAATAAATQIAPAFDSGTAYSKGDYVFRNNYMYRFTADHAAGDWIGSDATAVTVGSELKRLDAKIDSEVSDLNTEIGYKNLVTFPSNSSIPNPISSITKSGTNITVSFSSNIYLIVTLKNNRTKYVGISVANQTYTINNTCALTYDVSTAELSVMSISSSVIGAPLGDDTIVLIANVFGYPYSPINGMNDFITDYYSPANRAYPYRDISVLPAFGDNTVINSVTLSGINATVTFKNKPYIVARNNLGGQKYFSFPETNLSFTLANTTCLYYNMDTGALQIASISGTNWNAVLSGENIVLIVNVLGTCVSPIPSLNYYLMMAQNTIKGITETVSAMGNGGSYPIIGGIAAGTGNSETVTFGNHLVLNRRSGKRETHTNFLVSGQSFTVQNTEFLIADFSDSTVSVASPSTILTADQVVIMVNLWGKLVSSINGLQEELRAYFYPQENETTVTTVTIEPSPAAFCKIRTAIQNITDATAKNRYKVFVKNGTYEEIDIITKDYVDIVGETINGVIINCNGQSTENTPSDFSFPDYAGQPINEIGKANRHLFWHVSTSKISNLTMKSNDVKYILHQDASVGAYVAEVENCILIRDDDYNNDSSAYARSLQSLVGVGAKAGQYQIYRNCDFVKLYKNVPTNYEDHGSAMFWHNWNNQTGVCGATLENCNVFGCNIASISELGSAQADIINIINVKSDKDKYGILYGVTPGYWEENGVAVPAEDVPYFIKLIVSGANPNYVLLSDGRYDGYKMVENAYTESVFDSSVAISTGQPVTIPDFLNPKSAIATGSDFAFALESVVSGLVYVNTGKVGNGLMDAGTYTIKTPVYISNGKFTTTETGSIVGYVFKTTTIAQEGLVPIMKV